MSLKISPVSLSTVAGNTEGSCEGGVSFKRLLGRRRDEFEVSNEAREVNHDTVATIVW